MARCALYTSWKYVSEIDENEYNSLMKSAVDNMMRKGGGTNKQTENRVEVTTNSFATTAAMKCMLLFCRQGSFTSQRPSAQRDLGRSLSMQRMYLQGFLHSFCAKNETSAQKVKCKKSTAIFEIATSWCRPSHFYKGQDRSQAHYHCATRTP